MMGIACLSGWEKIGTKFWFCPCHWLKTTLDDRVADDSGVLHPVLHRAEVLRMATVHDHAVAQGQCSECELSHVLLAEVRHSTTHFRRF